MSSERLLMGDQAGAQFRGPDTAHPSGTQVTMQFYAMQDLIDEAGLDAAIYMRILWFGKHGSMLVHAGGGTFFALRIPRSRAAACPKASTVGASFAFTRRR